MANHSKKSTRKFEKKHLKPTLERRKEFAKIKQRHQVQDKKKARRAQENAKREDGEEGTKVQQKKEKDQKAKEAFESMTVDEFFAGGFDVPELAAENGKGKKGTKGEKRLGEGKAITGKRKREQEREEEQSAQSGSEAESADETEEGHKGELKTLAKKDTEFYEFLKKNDPELLDFDDNDLAGLELSDDKEAPKKKKKVRGQQHVEADNTVTLEMAEKWKQSLIKQQSLRTVREVILAFRAAVRTDEDDGKEYRYSVSSPDVYHQILVTALKHIPDVVQHHVPIKELASGKVRVPTDTKKYKTITPLLNSHAISLTHLLETLSDEATLKLTLTCIHPLLPYFLSFRKALKNLVKTVVGLWSDHSSSEATRISAFLLIRRFSVIGDAAIRESLLKAAYQGLVKGSRNTTVHTLAGINLMKNSAVDLWGVDLDQSYTTGFTYIRQLAIHLRTTLTHPTKDSYKAIYNWQYVHSLDFWSRVFSAHCSPAANPLLKKPTDSPLHALIYPLVQVTLGALRLIPTPTYFPLRFHLTRSLLRISRSTTTYIPLAPALLEVLQSPEVKDPPKPSTLKPLDFPTTLRAPKQYIRTRVYQDGVMEQVSDLLAEFFGCWSKSVAFPELIIPPTVLLKRWMKDVSTPNRKQPHDKKGKTKRPNPRLTAPISLLIQKLNLNAEYIERHRRTLDFAPKDRQQLEGFLRDVSWEDTPMGAFVAGIRKQREERERLLEKSRREDEERKKREKEVDEEESVIEEEDEDESESDGGVAVKGRAAKKMNGKARGKRAAADDDEEEEEEEEDDEKEWDDDDDDVLPDAEEGFIDDEAMEGEGDEEDEEEGNDYN
ncbi:MAG: hypothetical protein LQ340_003160 [Diploschistes diacapsis]|nr:MAG: hypothetical protein LQ340_003160 [Diploschistes diacapsis]